MALKLDSCLFNRRDFRHLIHFADPCLVETPDGMGGKDSTEGVLCSKRAKIEPCSAREIFENDQRKHDVSHKIFLRWPREFVVLPRYVIYFEQRRFRIEGIINVEERDMMIIDARELEGSDDIDALNALTNIFNTNGQAIFNTDGNPIFNTNLT